jgi:hypothetical protein
MRFHAKYVSASKAGDYYQVSFDTEDPGEDSTDPRGPDRPYLMIQRQFETLDDGQCYVETHDHGFAGAGTPYPAAQPAQNPAPWRRLHVGWEISQAQHPMLIEFYLVPILPNCLFKPQRNLSLS